MGSWGPGEWLVVIGLVLSAGGWAAKVNFQLGKLVSRIDGLAVALGNAKEDSTKRGDRAEQHETRRDDVVNGLRDRVTRIESQISQTVRPVG